MNAFIRLSLSLIGISLLTACGEEIDHNDIRQAGFVFCGQGKPTTFNPQLIDSGITAEALSLSCTTHYSRLILKHTNLLQALRKVGL